MLKGPTLIAYSDDPVAAPKVAAAFAKDYDKLVILGGAMGATALNPDGVRSLATMPSLDELRAKLVGLIQAPATKLAQLVDRSRRQAGARVRGLCRQGCGLIAVRSFETLSNQTRIIQEVENG